MRKHVTELGSLAAPHVMIPQLSLSELQQRGYRVDDESRRAFERRYRWVVVPAVVAVVGSACWLTIHQSPIGLLLFLGGMALCLGAALHAGRATPCSRITGRRMQRFRRSDGVGMRKEFIYVDDESRTYFVRLISEPSW
jgi:hypothetical protein